MDRAEYADRATCTGGKEEAARPNLCVGFLAART